MSGLPYSGGYYCKTKLWVGFLFNNFSWWGARFVLLVITMLTYVYLARLALIVFSSEKRGHWSIYIDK